MVSNTFELTCYLQLTYFALTKNTKTKQRFSTVIRVFKTGKLDRNSLSQRSNKPLPNLTKEEAS